MQHQLLARRTDEAHDIEDINEVLVTPCGCLGPCFDGPNAVIYPDGVWYAGLAVEDAAGLAEHLITGSPLRGKVGQRPGLP